MGKREKLVRALGLSVSQVRYGDSQEPKLWKIMEFGRPVWYIDPKQATLLIAGARPWWHADRSPTDEPNYCGHKHRSRSTALLCAAKVEPFHTFRNARVHPGNEAARLQDAQEARDVANGHIVSGNETLGYGL